MSVNKVIQNDTCFAARKRHRSCCPKTECKYWNKDESAQNCLIIKAEENDGMTLEQIGQIFGLTRMRVCQIEKNIYKKINQQLSSSLE